MVRRKSSTSSNSSNTFIPPKKKTSVLVGGKKKRKKPGVRALQEIRQLRRSTNLLIPKLTFSRLVKETVHYIFPRLDINRMQATALEALQEAAEMYLVQFFEDSILLAYHAKRVTLMKPDLILMRRLRGRDDVINR
ncbi:hypothetical protein HCN44_007071 [Aphidius gifuensis]|uniref:Core Histone H2A/H2B/H3 domain-containing protein n=1 Tax=Aphidius gifuensis TaxID=684658 RepID=A0A834XMM1_APHGI|nr:hypothetical protein HCN44_007071 [Aphidius gifuensis]